MASRAGILYRTGGRDRETEVVMCCGEMPSCGIVDRKLKGKVQPWVKEKRETANCPREMHLLDRRMVQRDKSLKR